MCGRAFLDRIRGGNTRSYNAYNSRGDVVSKTNDGGVITWQAAYEAFGTRTQEQGITEDCQKANTKDEDPTGLLNEGMRYRDLEFGVFITRDPADFVDGPNVYTYVRQNPWTKFDPLGLYETDGGSPFESSTIRSTSRIVLGGGAYENNLYREAHNAAVTGNTSALMSVARMNRGQTMLAPVLMRQAAAGWGSGKGDGSDIETIQHNFEFAGTLYLVGLAGNGPSAPKSASAEKFVPIRPKGGKAENPSPTGDSARAVQDSSGTTTGKVTLNPNELVSRQGPSKSHFRRSS